MPFLSRADRRGKRAQTLSAGPLLRRAALGLTVASGFAGLGYQIVWTQQAAVWLGHEAAAVLAVMTAFFGGLAVGAWVAGPRIERSARPERWYAACEASMAAWGLVLAVGMAPVSSAMLAATGAQPNPLWQWAVAFVGTFFLLLPATAAMGATLPAMARVLARWTASGAPVAPVAAAAQGTPAPKAASIAALYAGNTLGAVGGVLATAFYLVPEIGLTRTAGLCAALNLACAASVLLLGRSQARGKASAAGPQAADLQPIHPAQAALAGLPRPGVLPRLAATGLLGIGYEVLAIRVVSQVTENTVYTFALLLSVYLVGTAAGAAAYARGWMGQHEDTATRDRLIWLLAAACLLGTGSLWAAEIIHHAVLQGLGPGMAQALVAEAVLALAAFVLPTVLMGALFSHLSTQARSGATGGGRAGGDIGDVGFGRALGVNTLGAAAAPALFGVLLLPAWGAKLALLGVAGGYLALISAQGWRRPAVWATAAVTAGLALWAPPLVFVDVPEGGQVLSYQEGAMAAVSVVQDSAGVLRLRINNRQQEGSSATQFADARQALLPLLLHPAPQRALFLGLGTGNTAAAAAAAANPQLAVDVVELLPEVITASALFIPPPAPSKAESAAGLRLLAADARRFVRADGPPYDVIVSDNFHPARSGSAALYTLEHFQAVRARLAPGGLFCQWLPLHQLDLDTLRSVVRSFQAAYPGGWAMLATHSLDTPVLGLLARADGGRFDLGALRQRLQSSPWPQPLSDFGIVDELALLGGFIAGPSALAQFAGQAPLNTDDRAVVAYRAPRITYAPQDLPRDRLQALLQSLFLTPEELLEDGPERASAGRLAAYWAARNQYLASGRSVVPTADVGAMLHQVREPLLAVLRTSPDFRPAYEPLLRMAAALARSDAPGAQALLTELAATQAGRPEAKPAFKPSSPGPR